MAGIILSALYSSVYYELFQQLSEVGTFIMPTLEMNMKHEEIM